MSVLGSWVGLRYKKTDLNHVHRVRALVTASATGSSSVGTQQRTDHKLFLFTLHVLAAASRQRLDHTFSHLWPKRFVSLNDLKMRYVAAYLLATLGGNKSPSKDDISKVLSSVGIEADGAKLDKVIAELKGKSIDELITKGKYWSLVKCYCKYLCHILLPRL